MTGKFSTARRPNVPSELEELEKDIQGQLNAVQQTETSHQLTMLQTSWMTRIQDGITSWF